MSDNASLANPFKSGDAPTETLHSVVDPPSTLAEGSRRKAQAQQPRQLLSCTKCRERKVKCDRTKPCSACCARGSPKECHFVAEGGDYAPIQQSYELRKLRAENVRLKDRLRASKISIEDEDSDNSASPESQLGDRPVTSAHKRRNAKQKRFQGPGWSDSIYFGSPGLASIINDFASTNLDPASTQSLAHLMPRGADMYAPRNPPPHPFATLFKATPEECIPELLSCLPSRMELLEYLDSFQKRVHVCSFPHVPVEITKSEVERFLSDARKNAQMCPDMLALLFAALALGSQHSGWDKAGGQWKADVMKEESQRGNVYIAAAMQALRLASFMHKPTLLGIQALIMIGPYLTNSGRFLDAWTLFGTTIRLAQSIGLHRHPKFLDPAPPTQRECSIRQTLWWWMLHMDQEYSMTLGRPLGISGIGDCPPPHELTTDPRFLRFGQFVNHFTILARQILSSDRLSNAKIDDFTDSLMGLLDTMPEMLQFGESWLNNEKEIPEWPLGAMAAVYYCKTHNYLILLNRQRHEKPAPHSYPTPTNLSTRKTPPLSFHPVNPATSSESSPMTSPKEILRGRPLVLSSSEDLLTAFLFFYYRIPAALICWAIAQQAFNSCMILLLDAMETGDLSRIWKVEKVFAVFQLMRNNSVHQLASLAVERVSWGLHELQKIREQAEAAARLSDTIPGTRRDGSDDINMREAAESEASRVHGVMHDTVMGNTGMLLLEDSGLQSFVSEAFAPFTWVMAGGGQEGELLMRPKQVQMTGQIGYPHRNNMGTGRLDEGGRNLHSARSSEELEVAQQLQGSSQGSTPARYATFHTTPLQEHHQPQGLTSPPSPPLSATLQQQLPRPGEGAGASVSQQPPPHLRHHSYPSLHGHVPAPVVRHASRSSVHLQQLSRPVPQKSSSYYSLAPGHAPSQSPLQTLPEMIVQPYPLPYAGNPDVHPSWAARPAAPISSLLEPSLAFPHTSDQQHDEAVHAPQPAPHRPGELYHTHFHPKQRF
ncbi:hypothetical protein BDV95DRAFT_603321 [Massariosphaeria phaeospora]|uniref:Zn(2)-C6 fungal-type domain-containing protein n=1 Tax=Massariosphaeria phaeospora TaxID=100035 RepID=A0A7C8MVC4_9PLEO|nr:hypothetical protein BDV95DRAFT_603321 [Massariosphaeria phaeospora]